MYYTIYQITNNVNGKHGQLRAMKRWHFDNCTKVTNVPQ